jgi:ligand-binding sensor domain-containing protein
MKQIYFLLIVFVFIASCKGQNNPLPVGKSVATIAGDTVSELGNNIRCIFQDAENTMWFVTDGEGGYKYRNKTLVHLADKQGLCPNYAKTVLPHTSPIQKDTGSRFAYDIYSTCTDRNGHVWFGTCTAGVCRYDGKSYTWLDNRELGAPVRAIFEDKNGTIWFGTNGYGLLSYKGAGSPQTGNPGLTNFTTEHKLGNPDFLKTFVGKEGTLARVWTITDDLEGNLWIGTIDAGVWMYDGKKTKKLYA